MIPNDKQDKKKFWRKMHNFSLILKWINTDCEYILDLVCKNITNGFIFGSNNYCIS